MFRVPTYVWVAIGVVLLVFVIAGLFKAAEVAPKTSPNKVCKQLVQSAQQKCSAAQQDILFIQKMSDAQYGLAYVNAARMLSDSDASLTELCGVRVDELHTKLKSIQQEAYELICTRHPDLRL